MPKNERSFLKRRLIDVAGFFLIILGVLFGWLPGPGGIPLIFAGLALLSTNHAWADRLLNYLTHHAKNLVNILMPANKWWQLFYDSVAILLIFVSVILTYKIENSIVRSLATFLGVFGLMVLFINRRRAQKLARLWRRQSV